MNLTQEMVRSLFVYDEKSGVLTRAIKTSNNVRVGDVVGCLRPDGYLCVSIQGKLYQAHRVIWLYMNGSWPENQIDHINGNRSDNRLSNLRDVSNLINGRNQRLRSSNKSGTNGVFWFASRKKWRAVISISGKETHIGYFDSIEEAAKARSVANALHGFHGNHGLSDKISGVVAQ